MDDVTLTRIKNAAIDCLKDEIMSILNIHPIEFNGKQYVMFKAELQAEIKKRILEYHKIARTSK